MKGYSEGDGISGGAPKSNLKSGRTNVQYALAGAVEDLRNRVWYCAFLIYSIAFVDSIGRFLDRPLAGAGEIVSFTLSVFFFSSFALVVQGDTHIRVGLAVDFYGNRARFAERIFTSLFEVLAALGLVWLLVDQGRRYLRFGSLSSRYETPMAPWPMIGAGFVAVALLFIIAQCVNILRAGPNLSEEAKQWSRQSQSVFCWH